MYLDNFNEKYQKFLKEKLIPESIINDYELNLSLYLPIIIVNGNIYMIDMDKPITDQGFIERQEKVPGFIHEFNYFKIKRQKKINYYHFTRFFLELLKDENLCFEDDRFFPQIYEPQLDVIITSLDSFPEVFNKIHKEIELKINSLYNSGLKDTFKRNEKYIKCLNVFSWFLSKASAFKNDFFTKCFEKYKQFRRKTRMNNPKYILK